MATNRTFQARVTWYQLLLLLILGGNLIYMLWVKVLLPSLFFALLLILLIETIVNSTYCITADDTLEIKRGRYLRKVIIPLSAIKSVRRVKGMTVNGHSAVNYVLINYNGRFISATPRNNDEMLKALRLRGVNVEA